MEEVIRFAFLGFGIGALYALGSQGLIVIYRGSGVLNFAMGAIGMAGVFLWWDLHVQNGWGFWPALVVGVGFSALIGALTHLLIMRPLRRSSPLVRVIATLGVLVTLQAIAVLRYGSTPRFVTSQLPTDIVHIHGTIVISADRLILLGIAAVLTLGLWLLYRFTTFGLATSAVAENERAAAALGWSPDRIAAANWVLGSALAGLAAILIAPIVTLQVTVMTNLILAAIAAALVAQFRSFPTALLAGVAIGIAQTELNRYVHQPGFGDSVPFIVIVVMLVITGQALPLRDYFLQRLPSIGSGRINWRGIGFGAGLTTLLLATLSTQWTDAITVTLCAAFVLLSIVVVTGYAGQLSLAQYAIAGFGAWVAGRLVASQGTPFWLALIIGVVATVPVGVAFAIPAVRTRGINLAVVTLGLGTAMELMLFRNPAYTGGIGGTQVGDAKLFGWDINSISHPTRYGLFVLVLFVACVVVVANVRRGRSGRRMIAVRTNERAAAALGISVPAAKLYAFGLSAAISALGGILLVFRLSSVDYTEFTNFTSIFSSSVGKYIDLIGGISILVIVLLNQDGIAREQINQIRGLRTMLGARLPRLAPRVPRARELPDREVVPVSPRTLQVHDLSVA
ncbi:MAG: hypothetical protein QOF86_2639, partial [Baekduia sp.]|nr:hypothetical protein [Baekduia sp.]